MTNATFLILFGEVAFLIFVKPNSFVSMNLIIIAIVIAIAFLVIVQTVRNVRYEALVTPRSGHLPKILVAGIVMSVTDIILGGDVFFRFAVDLSVMLLSVLMLNFSVPLKESAVSVIMKIILSFELALSFYYVLCTLNVMPQADNAVFIMSAAGVVMSIGLLFLWMIWKRIYEIKALLKSGTVWSFLNLSVDAVYVLAPIMTVIFAAFVYCLTGSVRLTMGFAVVIIAAELLAASFRIVLDSAFVLLQKHERVIVESMKISHGEVAGSNMKLDDMYKEVYERIVLYFEMHKPFLDSELTINDVVKVVYSNKVYISRAISHFTGRNFRQFVNYHRVIHSMDVFRRNPSLKVAELANLRGFNSVVSFTSAFRLFMNETPSEWCRKEKTRIVKTKN